MSVLIYFHLKILQLTPDKYVDFLQYVCSYGILSSCSVKIQLYTCDKCKAKLCVPIWYLKYLLCENLASHSKQAYAYKNFLAYVVFEVTALCKSYFALAVEWLLHSVGAQM